MHYDGKDIFVVNYFHWIVRRTGAMANNERTLQPLMIISDAHYYLGHADSVYNALWSFQHYHSVYVKDV